MLNNSTVISPMRVRKVNGIKNSIKEEKNVFCCIVAWQLLSARFFVYWKWNQVRISWGICEDNLWDIRKVIDSRKSLWNCQTKKLQKMFETISFWGSWKKSYNKICLDNKDIFLGDILLEVEILKLLYCCPALELFSCLPLARA